MAPDNGSRPHDGHSSPGESVLGTDITAMAAENAAYGERVQRDPYAFSGQEIRATFLTGGQSLIDDMLRSVYEKEVHHLVAMQIEQGLRVLRLKAANKPGDLPSRVRDLATLPPALQSAMIAGVVSAAKDGAARQEALVAWSGQAMMMGKRRNLGDRVVNPAPQAGGGLS